MKLYIDSRNVGVKKYYTLVKVYSHGKFIKAGVLQKAPFCLIEIEKIHIEDIELRFSVINQIEYKEYDKCSICNLNDIPNIRKVECYNEFSDYDIYSEVSRESQFVPKEWIYAYNTHVRILDEKVEDLLFVFNSEPIEDIYLCEVVGGDICISHEKIVSNDVLTKSFHKWLLRWIGLESIVLPLGLGLMIVAILFTFSIDWHPSAGKAPFYLLVLVALIVLFIPNGTCIILLKDNVKKLKQLKATQILKL